MARIKKTEEQQEAEPVAVKTALREYVLSVGRRRESTARVRLYAHKDAVMWGDREAKRGDILVNHLPVAVYFKSLGVDVRRVDELFKTTNTVNKFIITALVNGGGTSGQLDAVMHAIARAVSLFDTKAYRSILKKKGYLMRDARVRERRKVGTGGKARRQKQSPKR